MEAESETVNVKKLSNTSNQSNKQIEFKKEKNKEFKEKDIIDFKVKECKDKRTKDSNKEVKDIKDLKDLKDKEYKEIKLDKIQSAIPDGDYQQKNKISKFDMIKVKVMLGEHWFIFSRYILSKLLIVIRISEKDSQRIAFELKRKLVGLGLLDVQLKKFQELLFKTFDEFGYDKIFQDRYLMMNSFYSKRVPLVILISGSISVGKSTIANKLSEKMNISNVLQTKIVSFVMSGLSKNYCFEPFWKDASVDYKHMLNNDYSKKDESNDHDVTDSDVQSIPLTKVKSNISNLNEVLDKVSKLRTLEKNTIPKEETTKILNNDVEHYFEENTKEDVSNLSNSLKAYISESKIIRKGCSLDMLKAFTEGKPVILEGHHIIPKNFITKDSDGRIIIYLPEMENESKHEKSIREEVNNLKIKGLVVPFLITLNSETHKSYILKNNYISKEDKFDAVVAFTEVQEYLQKNNNYFIEIDATNKKTEDIVDCINVHILNEIEKEFKKESFLYKS